MDTIHHWVGRLIRRWQRLRRGVRRWFSVGARGERYAARYLRRRGYVVLTRNWRSGRHELDIVALRGRVLVIIEVKTRSEGAWVGGMASVDERKRGALRAATRKFVRRMHPPPEALQFDVVEVWLCNSGGFRVSHLPNIALFPEGFIIYRNLWPIIKDTRFSGG